MRYDSPTFIIIVLALLTVLFIVANTLIHIYLIVHMSNKSNTPHEMLAVDKKRTGRPDAKELRLEMLTSRVARLCKSECLCQ